MKKPNQQTLRAALALLAAFALWTAAICLIDVQPIGPQGSFVGFAALNSRVHHLTGVHLSLYQVTDWLSLVPLAFVLGFAGLGLSQWLRRKSLAKVDRDLLLLGLFYLAVLASYVLFEQFPINHRPVLIDGVLETSYPSSTTLLVLTIMPTAGMQLKARLRTPALKQSASAAITVFTVCMVAGRLVSGVHWITDIIGGILLSAGLVLLYASLAP